MSDNSDSQNLSGSPPSMIDDNVSSGTSTSSHVVSASPPVVDLTRERRRKSSHDCSTSSRALEELVLHASPLTIVMALGDAIGVPVFDQYETMIGLADRSPLHFAP